jgi:hypothetical protein
MGRTPCLSLMKGYIGVCPSILEFPSCFADGLLQITVAGPGVNHHGVQTFVPQERSELLERNAGIDQVLAKRMAQGMGRYLR